MSTQLIELTDGTLVEIEVHGRQVRKISGGMADKVKSSLNKIKPILINTCRPVTEAWRELNKEMYIDEAEIELGLSFEGEGNIYITKTKAGANLIVRLKVKPKA